MRLVAAHFTKTLQYYIIYSADELFNAAEKLQCRETAGLLYTQLLLQRLQYSVQSTENVQRNVIMKAHTQHSPVL